MVNVHRKRCSHESCTNRNRRPRDAALLQLTYRHALHGLHTWLLHEIPAPKNRGPQEGGLLQATY